MAEDFLEDCNRSKVSQNKKLNLNQCQINKKKKKFWMKKVENFKPEEEPDASVFDERINKTKVEVRRGATGTKRFEVKKEEHWAVILYPGEQFAGHVLPKDGTGAGLARDLIAFTRERGITTHGGGVFLGVGRV